jgi:hypothetical protein
VLVSPPSAFAVAVYEYVPIAVDLARFKVTVYEPPETEPIV